MTATQGQTGIAQTLGAGEELVFDATSSPSMSGCTTMYVRCRTTSPVSVVVRIPELHGLTGGLTLLPGESQSFRVGNVNLTRMYLTGNTAVVDWAPISNTGG